jgi:hypothetical protein
MDDAKPVVIAQGHDEFGQFFIRDTGAKLTIQCVSRGLPERAAGVTAADPRSAKADEADRSALAKEVTRDLGVDTVLLSRVVAGSPLHPSDWGRNTEGSRRLYLYLITRDGHLLWKDELPFVLAKGFTSPQEASVQTDLRDHVMQHVNALRLDELGYLPKKTVYRVPKKVGILTR